MLLFRKMHWWSLSEIKIFQCELSFCFKVFFSPLDFFLSLPSMSCLKNKTTNADNLKKSEKWRFLENWDSHSSNLMNFADPKKSKSKQSLREVVNGFLSYYPPKHCFLPSKSHTCQILSFLPQKGNKPKMTDLAVCLQESQRLTSTMKLQKQVRWS